VLERHGRARSRAARERALALLHKVRIDDPVRRLDQYPHELSGGQRQRVLIAIAVACDPVLLIADEPTTALDVTVQAGVLALLAELRAERRLAVVLVSHDFGVVSRLADRIFVMYAGRVVEEGPASAVMAAPRHPYTAALLACIARMDDALDTPLSPIPGQPPEPRALPPGCAFHPRCSWAKTRCRSESPVLAADGLRAVACHFPLSP
jgi:oligopeptide/dipeptide ABC transporter ATP-binding protein